MKIPVTLLAVVTLLTGCYTRREVVYEDTPRTTIIQERAGTPVRVYEQPVRVYAPTRVYYTPRHRLGGNYPYPRRGYYSGVPGE